MPVGKKVYAWPERPFEWLFELPAWQRAVFLSAFMSAEGSTPALASGTGYIAALAVKQSGVTDAAIRFVERLFASLGFVVHVTRERPCRARTGARATSRSCRAVSRRSCATSPRSATTARGQAAAPRPRCSVSRRSVRRRSQRGRARSLRRGTCARSASAPCARSRRRSAARYGVPPGARPPRPVWSRRRRVSAKGWRADARSLRRGGVAARARERGDRDERRGLRRRDRRSGGVLPRRRRRRAQLREQGRAHEPAGR